MARATGARNPSGLQRVTGMRFMMQALKHDSGTLDHSAPCGRPCHGVWHYHYESAKHIGFNLKTPVMIGCADPCHSIFFFKT